MAFRFASPKWAKSLGILGVVGGASLVSTLSPEPPWDTFFVLLWIFFSVPSFLLLEAFVYGLVDGGGKHVSLGYALRNPEEGEE